MTAIETVKRDRLRRLLADRTEPELRAILYHIVPYVREFLADEICEYATNTEVDALLASYEAEKCAEVGGKV